MMNTLKKSLLDDLNNGFSHHTINSVAKQCTDWIAANNNPSVNLLAVFAIQNCCCRVCEFISGNAPNLPQNHDELEQTIIGPLTAAIESLDGNDEVKIGSASSLVVTINNLHR